MKGYIYLIETPSNKIYIGQTTNFNKRLKRHTEETINKLSQYRGENHWNFGGSVSEETKRKISESQKGEKHWNFGGTITEEHKNKISEKMTGRKMSEIAKIKFTQHNDSRKRKVIIDTPKT